MGLVPTPQVTPRRCITNPGGCSGWEWRWDPSWGCGGRVICGVRWVCVLGEGVTSNTPIAWAGAVGVWRLPLLSAASLPFLNSHSGDKSPSMVSWGQGHERDALSQRWLWERSLKLALPSVEERPLVRHHLPWGPWGSTTFPSLHCPLVSKKVGWKGEMEAGWGPGQVTGRVDSNALSLWPGHSPCCRSLFLSSFWRSVSG